MGADSRLAIEHGDAQAVVAQGNLARGREPDDARADDREVAFARRIGAGRWRDGQGRSSLAARIAPG